MGIIAGAVSEYHCACVDFTLGGTAVVLAVCELVENREVLTLSRSGPKCLVRTIDSILSCTSLMIDLELIYMVR